MAALIDGNSNGVFIISITPFKADGSIDWASTDRLIDFYLDRGVSGVTILGILGEAHKLSESESLDFAKHYLRRIRGRVPVIVGASLPANDRIADFSAACMDSGAGGVMIAPLGGLKTDQAVLDYYAGVFQKLDPKTPVCFQDYPQTTGVHISAGTFITLVDRHPSMVMFKHEDSPGLRKLSQIRKACDGGAHRRVSILCGNGGLHLPQEMRRGADGAMTGFAYPEMLVDVARLGLAGDHEAAEDIFDAYLPLVRHEQQAGIGLALRKEVLRRRGALESAALRAPGPKLDADDVKELDELMARLGRRLQAMGRTG
jgi:4-hydroxy-tetrahydrodipicolinate synthase